jgi:hypothetical protein
MRRLGTIGAFLLLISLLIPFASGDQSLPLTFSTCGPLGTAAELSANRGPNVNNCRKSGINIQNLFTCTSQSSMWSCHTRCQDCDVRYSAAANITMDNACISATSPLWHREIYVGGKGWTPI